VSLLLIILSVFFAGEPETTVSGYFCPTRQIRGFTSLAHLDGFQISSLAVGQSLTDRTIAWPEWQAWKRVLLLQDYNTRIVMLGTGLLGMAAGMVGSFTLLRRRALMGDALSHATLPGVGLAFLLAPLMGFDEKSLPVLLTGAALSGSCGVFAILYVRSMTRLKEDAALGIVLSVFFGAGIAILSIVQQLPAYHAAGLESFIYGKTASINASDARLIALSGMLSVVVVTLMFKELTLLCFDEGFAASRGYPIRVLDLLLMTLVVVVTIIGLQAVGLVLMIALLVIPAAAARFWTHDLRRMTLISSAIGGVGGIAGSAMSGLFDKLPSGPMIVIVCSCLFFLSMLFGRERGVLVRVARRLELNRSVDRQHLLRGMFELLETRETKVQTTVACVTFSELLAMRTWSRFRLLRQIEQCRKNGLLVRNHDASLSLTATGLAEAARLVHEHRLWEIYLITQADVATGRVDQAADAIEHVLEPELIAQLEQLLAQQRTADGVIASPHPLDLEIISGSQSSANPAQSFETKGQLP
jgi:manganese/zinc/iron transport system permease protein